MAEPTPPPTRSARWLAVIWVFGTIAAIAVSVGAVRLAGAQVTVRHPPPLTGTEVSAAMSVDGSSSELGDDSSSDGTSDDHGSSDDSLSDGSGASGSDSSGSGASGSGSSGSSGSGGSDDKGGSTPTSGSSGGGGSDGSGGSSGSGGSGGSGGSDDGGTSGDGGHAATTSTTSPAVAVFSKSTTGGAVTIRCTGDTVALVSVIPAAGWSSDLRNPGPQEVEVRFEAKDSEVRVRARCASGVVTWSS
jgi:hypothetical protein